MTGTGRKGVLLRAVVAIAAVIAGAAGNAQDLGSPGTRAFEVRSNPPGATVETITGAIGETPVDVQERDIYPNTYPREKVDLYGVVRLRRPGCEPVVIRVTERDIQRGLSVSLACAAAAENPEPKASDPGLEPVPEAYDAGAESLPERRLRQLRVLQELLDEGLITGAEEERIRRRILQAD